MERRERADDDRQRHRAGQPEEAHPHRDRPGLPRAHPLGRRRDHARRRAAGARLGGHGLSLFPGPGVPGARGLRRDVAHTSRGPRPSRGLPRSGRADRLRVRVPAARRAPLADRGPRHDRGHHHPPGAGGHPAGPPVRPDRGGPGAAQRHAGPHRSGQAHPAQAGPRRGSQRGGPVRPDRSGPAHPRRRDRQPRPDRQGRHRGGP
jgi:hypothetical protein